MSPTRYSLIVPVYRNEETIPALVEAAQALSARRDGGLELVLVVDGSPDRSYARLREELQARSLRAQLICLSRNFGSFAAIRHGLEVATGPYFAVMTADLQEPPELIDEFFETLEKEPVDIVLGTRTDRDDPISVRLPASVFWAIYRRLVQPEMPAGGIDVFGINQIARDALLRLGESHSSLVGQLLWLGFRRKEIPYRRRPRAAGQSAWTLHKRLRYMRDSIFAFTHLPIRLLGVIGAVGLGLTSLATVIVVIAYVQGSIQIPGYSPIILAILFSTFFNLLGLGIVGSYLWRTYENSKERPHSLVLVHEIVGEQESA